MACRNSGWTNVGSHLAATLVVGLFSILTVRPTAAQNTAYGTGALGNNTTGDYNSAFGYVALNLNTTGTGNTATGALALEKNITGGANTATGEGALLSNSTGSTNTATGFQALLDNSTGGGNTASGYSALYSNTTGGTNTATGYLALYSNTVGYFNTATGADALFYNTTGNYNTASGVNALEGNTTGYENTATGVAALLSNTTGYYNTASGFEALRVNTTGYGNTAAGFEALFNNSTGDNNIAVGVRAGRALTTGSNNIDLGNEGVADEANTIRIGTPGTQVAAFIAGIYGTGVGSSPRQVFVDSSGHLGTRQSSARFKRDINDMGAASSGLMKLRPVTFRYKQDPAGSLQYGLVAEEVERVYPELVTRGVDGKVDGVRYELLPAMLLNEVQKQARENKMLARQIGALTTALKKKDAQIDALDERINALDIASPALPR